MAQDPSTAAAKGDRVLSAEEAERLAARYRPSWEVDDEIATAGGPEVDLAAAQVKDAAAQAAPVEAFAIEAPDTIIEGIPTITVDADGDRGALARSGDADGADRSDEVKGTRSRRPIANGVSGAKGAVALAPPAPAGKTKIGLGAGGAEAEPRPAPPPSVQDPGSRASAALLAEDSIQIPVSGGGKDALLKVAIAVVGVAFLYFSGRVLLGSGDEDPTATPEPVAKPAAASPGPTAAPPIPPPPATTAAASAPTRPPVAAPAETTRPAPRANPTAGAKPAAGAPTPGGTPPSGGKKGGGIIREAPF